MSYYQSSFHEHAAQINYIALLQARERYVIKTTKLRISIFEYEYVIEVVNYTLGFKN